MLVNALIMIYIILVFSNKAPNTTRILPKMMIGKVLLKEMDFSSRSKKEAAKGIQIPK